jgi:hydrogenase maturation protease
LIRIIGIGNRMHGDDGLGPCLAYALSKCGNWSNNFSFIPLDLPNHGDIALLEDPDTIIIIDTSLEPINEIFSVDPTNISALDAVRLAQSGSGHSITPITLLALAHIVGVLTDKRVFLQLIGPLEPAFGRGLSSRAVELGLEAARKIESFLGDIKK